MNSKLLEGCRSLAPRFAWEAVAPRESSPLRAPGVPLAPIRRAMRRAERPQILVNDSARVPLQELAAVLGDLWEHARERPILVATGTHREDLARMRDRLGGLPCELHQADDEAAHETVGKGPWRLDRRVLEADLVVAFGSVEPHYFAGWAGAHKTATIGVASRETIARNHEHALSSDSRPLALEGNPIFDDLRQLLVELERRRRLLAVNHVLDGAGRPLAVGVGTWRGALQRVLAAAERRFVAPCPEPVQVLVARPEGPLGESLYQADKAIKNHELAVASGGDIIVWSEALSQAGSDRFLTLLRAAPDHAAALAEVARAGYVLGDHKAVRLRALQARGVRIHVAAPSLDPEALAGTGIAHHPSLEAALAEVQAPEGRALLVDDAGVVVSSLPS